jgi:antitoxin ParD1/3/4
MTRQDFLLDHLIGSAGSPPPCRETSSPNQTAQADLTEGIEASSKSCYQYVGALKMSNIEKVSIALTKEHVELAKNAVASGEYASVSEVVREALREWHLRQPLRQAEVERLRKAWKEGIESGPPELFDIEEIKRKARQTFEAAKRSA